MKSRMSSLWNGIVRHKWILLGIVLVTLFVFSNYIVGFKLSFTNVNYSFAPFDSTATAIDGPLLSDIADSHYPTIMHAFYNDEGISLWDSDIALGRSAGTIAEYMNPMNWVHVFPFGLAIFLKAFSEFAIGFAGMYLFMRSIGIRKYAASLSGVVYAFSASIVMWLGWAHSDVAVWAPFLFFAIEKLMETVHIKYMFLIALVVYIMLIVGMPTYTAYFMYLAGLYIVIFTIKRHWHQKRNIFIVGGMFAVGVILAVAASLPYTITLLGDVVGNGYMGSRASYGEAQLSWGYLRTLLFPYMRDGLTMHTNESTLFVGVISVVVLPFSLCNMRAKKRNLFFVAATVAVFLLIFTGVLNVVYTHLPMINTSLKYRVIVLLMFTMAVLTGITLNDIFVNKDYYRKKPWLIAVAVVWIVGALLIIGKDLIEPYTKITCAMGVFMMVLAGCIALLVKKDYKPVYALLAVLVCFNSAWFVREYLPWVDADAPIIPSATDSVTYMAENTQAQERIAGIGTWTLFPNTPSYYELNDIRMHGFEATNADMSAYYKTIDNDAYLTNTRLELNTIENYELLQYMGVKYIYGEAVGEAIPVGADAPHSKAYGAVAPHSSLYQTITLEDDPQMLSILLATYGNTPQSDSKVVISLTAKDTSERVFETTIPVSQIKDNAKLNVMLDTETPIQQGTYIVELAFGDLQTDTITVWMKEDAQSVVSGSNGDMPGAMAMWATYPSEKLSPVYSGDDGLMVAQMTAYADKAELAETLTVCAAEDEVLSTMASGYVDNAAFTVGTDATVGYDRPLERDEGATVMEYTDDRVVIRCRSYQERYLVLNDYYDADWKAYINGEEVAVEKINYLMRGVKINGGDEDIVVEFCYEPTRLFAFTYVSLAVIVIAVVLFVFHRRLQAGVDKLKG